MRELVETLAAQESQPKSDMKTTGDKKRKSSDDITSNEGGDKKHVSFSPATKSERLEGDSTIKMLHDMAAHDESNQASLDNFNDEVDTHYVALVHDNNRGHYVALVHVNGGLYELDGRKEGPIRHCDTAQETLLKDACKVVENFMKRYPHEMRFSILALVPKNILVLSPKMTSK